MALYVAHPIRCTLCQVQIIVALYREDAPDTLIAYHPDIIECPDNGKKWLLKVPTLSAQEIRTLNAAPGAGNRCQAKARATH